ncbi:MAG: leucine-rich repeat domain-containing protein [Clostridia bacterium]|nr:leucine-rich repeat domain-containing protein [Clostridia bacterium]
MKALKILLALVVSLAVFAMALSSCGGNEDNSDSTPSANSSGVSNNGDNVASSTVNSGNLDNDDDTNDSGDNTTDKDDTNNSGDDTNGDTNDDTNNNDSNNNDDSGNNEDSNNNGDGAVDESRVVIDNIVYTLDESGTCYYVSEIQSGYGESIEIKEECNGKSVVRLATKLFENISGVKSISIPKTITEIEYRCFANCSDLTSISVAQENTVYKSIDGNLYSFDEETLIVYAIGKTSESFVVPESVHKIDDYAFKDCTAIKNVQFSSKLYGIGSYAFEGCANLTDVVFPSSLNTLGTASFASCTSIETITITRNLEVSAFAFAYCTSLKEILVDEHNYRYSSIDGNLYYVDKPCVLVQYALGKEDTHFDIPDYVTEIGDAAFCGAENLVSISTGDSRDRAISNIGNQAFRDCINLESIFINEGINQMGIHVFAGCEKLTIYCEKSESDIEMQISARKWSAIWNPDNCPVEYDYVASK